MLSLVCFSSPRSPSLCSWHGLQPVKKNRACNRGERFLIWSASKNLVDRWTKLNIFRAFFKFPTTCCSRNWKYIGGGGDISFCGGTTQAMHIFFKLALRAPDQIAVRCVPLGTIHFQVQPYPNTRVSTCNPLDLLQGSFGPFGPPKSQKQRFPAVHLALGVKKRPNWSGKS